MKQILLPLCLDYIEIHGKQKARLREYFAHRISILQIRQYNVVIHLSVAAVDKTGQAIHGVLDHLLVVMLNDRDSHSLSPGSVIEDDQAHILRNSQVQPG